MSQQGRRGSQRENQQRVFLDKTCGLSMLLYPLYKREQVAKRQTQGPAWHTKPGIN